MKILYFAPINYSDLKQRPQHIAELLSRNHEVYYIEPTVSIVKYLIKGGANFRKQKYERNGVHIIKLDGTWCCHRSIEAFRVCKVNSWWETFQLRQLARECDTIWVGYSGWYQIVKNLLSYQKLIFDKMDEEAELTENRLLKRHLKRGEDYLIAKADCIFVTAQVFYERLRRVRNEVYLVANGMDTEIFPNQIEIPEPKICHNFLYIGHVGHWFDRQAVQTILSADEKNIVTIVGTTSVEEIADERVINVGFVDKSKLYLYLEQADACLYPFKLSSWIDTINPVKIYEYLCFNKPVIAVESRELNQFGEYIYKYSSLDYLGCLVRGMLKAPFSTDEIRIQFFSQNNWENRVEKIETIMKNIVKKEELV